MHSNNCILCLHVGWKLAAKLSGMLSLSLILSLSLQHFLLAIVGRCSTMYVYICIYAYTSRCNAALALREITIWMILADMRDLSYNIPLVLQQVQGMAYSNQLGPGIEVRCFVSKHDKSCAVCRTVLSMCVCFENPYPSTPHLPSSLYTVTHEDAQA